MKTLQPAKLTKASLPYAAADVSIQTATFVGPDGLEECHLMLQSKEVGDFGAQLDHLADAYAYALSHLGCAQENAVLRRFFCSDPANQQAILEAHPLANSESPCVISFVGQPPLTGGKLALWAYHVKAPEGTFSKRKSGNTLELQRGGLTHYWSTNCVDPEGADSYVQTETIFQDYIRFLAQHEMTPARDVVRTWLYVRDVDSNYQGLVDARRELFLEHGLGPTTNYIASTGIEGRSAEASVKVSMDAYAVHGLQPGQIRFLEAPDFLGPTHLYGVSFERATATRFRDRQHIYISGKLREGKTVGPPRT